MNYMADGSEIHMNMSLFKALEGVTLEEAATLDLSPFIVQPQQ